MNIYQPLNLKTINFRENAKQIHDNKYGYELAIYTTAHAKIKITCPIHGLFEQRAYSHLAGQGCRECSRTKKLTTESFIQKAKETHGDKYDYSLVEYITAHNKVQIKCLKHNTTFQQKPFAHIRGNRCPMCAKESCAEQLKKTQDSFISEAKEMHGNKYDYSAVEYKNSTTKVKIICKLHDDFLQIPGDHLSGKGCKKCSKGNTSKSEQKWIASFNNSNINEQHIIILPTGNKVRVDGFDSTTNTIYEYYGKFWHGHPEYSKCDPDFMIGKKSAGDRYIETLMREIRLKELGYNIVSVWI
jgi:hypothetical protein